MDLIGPQGIKIYTCPRIWTSIDLIGLQGIKIYTCPRIWTSMELKSLAESYFALQNGQV